MRSLRTREVIATRSNTTLVSAAAAWGLSIKKRLGRIDFPQNLAEALDAGRTDVLPVDLAHVPAAAALRLDHRRPFDRVQIAHGLTEQRVLVTSDARFDAYGVTLLGA
ncbi:MAG TPA: type II toxin-antitoxin system VapC family toxin [Phycisphaerales bacterium]|nr:type II toxin-antitoxin system VapC family toxin [Phycisphaerales bacterium]HMP36211.1 type II toxin-antitoxin system VapC family toxin [Phycisphaerales bacterium]